MATTADVADRVGMTSSRLDQGTEMITRYLEHLRRSSCTADTIKLRRQVLRSLHRELPGGLGETTEEELARWLYRDAWTQNTRATYYRALRSFYGWASDPRDPWISFDPTIDLPVARNTPGVPRSVTDDQLRRILTEAAQPIRLWATVAAYQGLRCMEIAGLDREHVNELTLHVVRGKGGRPRVHDTDPSVWAAVRDLPRGPVAIWRGRRATAYEVSFQSASEFDRLGMPDVTLHKLRHWLGVTTQRLYKNVRVTQKVLGHVSLASTQIYTDATSDELRAARAMLPRLAG